MELNSPAALIPAGFGAVLLVCGLLAVKANVGCT